MNKRIYLAFAVLSGCLWGATGIFTRGLLAFGMDPTTMTFLRMSISLGPLAIGIFIFDKSLFKIKLKDAALLFICGLTGMMGVNLCYIKAIGDLSLSLAAVLLAIYPVYVIFLAAAMFKEKITARMLICTAFALSGCFLVSGIMEADGLEWTWIGIFFGFCAGLFYGIYTVLSKIAMQRGYTVFTIVFYSMFISSLCLLPFADWNIIADYVSTDTLTHVIILVTYSFCTSVLPYILFTSAMHHIEAGKVSLISSAGEPSSAAIFGMIFFAEMLSPLSIAGLVITIVALAFITKDEVQ